MGRDWTPRESYENEQLNIAEGRGDKWYFLEHLEFHWADGPKERVCPDEELALRKQFPMLGKLMSNTGEFNFLSLYEMLAEIPGGVDLLHTKDLELAMYIEKGVGDRNSALIKWFEGELDSNFYYSEHNDFLFGESILTEAMLLANKKKHSLDGVIDSATKRSLDTEKGSQIIDDKEQILE